MANGRTSESNPLKSIEFLVNNDAGWHVLFKLDINNILNAPTNTAHYQDLFYALVVIFQKLQKQFTTLQPALKRELQNQAHRQSFQVQKQEGEDQQILEQYVMSVREILFTLMQKLDPTHNAPQLVSASHLYLFLLLSAIFRRTKPVNALQCWLFRSLRTSGQHQ